jgi:hypothetical protein
MILGSVPTRKECEELVWDLEFQDIIVAAMVEIALKAGPITPYMVACGEA